MLSSQVVSEWVDVESVTYSRHKKEGRPDSIKVSYNCGLKTFSEWLCPDHGGYAASRYLARMSALGATATTTVDALVEAPVSWTWPTRIKIRPRTDDPRFEEIMQLDYSEGRKPEPPGKTLSWDDGPDDNVVQMTDWRKELDEIPF